MNTSDLESRPARQTDSSKILRHGFRHPRSESVSSSGASVRTEPPEIKWKACTWDTIEDEPKEREDEPAGGSAP